MLAFALASAAVAAPPSQGPLPEPSDEAALRRLAAAATAPSIEAERAKLNGILTARLRVLTTENQPPTPAARQVLPATPHAACSDPMISRIVGGPNADATVTPNYDFSIAGCGFGTAVGSATLDLGGSIPPLHLPVLPVCTEDYVHEISCWQDYAVVFNVPHIEGVKDLQATFVLTTASGKTLQVPIKFVALRQSVVVYGAPPIHGNCSHKTNNDDCITTKTRPITVTFDPRADNFSVLAQHQSLCCFTGVRDHDDYQVSGLPPQWTIGPVVIATDPQLPYCSNAFSNPNERSSATLEAPVYSADKSTVNFRIDYSVGPVCSLIAYAISIVASGPLGTSTYVINPPTGHR